MTDNEIKDYEARKTIVNNLKSIEDGKFFGNGKKARFVLRQLSEHGLGAQQNIIVTLVLDSFARSPKFDDVREKITREWDKTHGADDSSSDGQRAKHILGQLSYYGLGSKQSLIVSMMLDSFDSNPDYDKIRSAISLAWENHERLEQLKQLE